MVHDQYVNVREFLLENNISTNKLVIALEAETIEDFDDYSVDDIVSVSLNSEARGSARIIDHIQESREGWGK